jgi:hypothetical protein
MADFIVAISTFAGLQNVVLSSEPLYDPDLLKRLDFSQSKTKFDPPISPSEPGEALIVRPLCAADYDKGGKYISCLSKKFLLNLVQMILESQLFVYQQFKKPV